MSKVVSFGEVLLRLAVPGAQRFTQALNLEVVYGGSEANIAAAVAQWGIATRHVTVLPQNEIGLAALQALRAHQVDTTYIQRAEGRMGIYFLEHGAHVRAPKVIYDRYHSAFAQLDPGEFNWEEILQDAEWFHWSGITPAVSANAALACKAAIQVARRKNIRVSADINYRRVLWRYGKKPVEIMPELVAQSDLLVGAPIDFENCLGLKILSGVSYQENCNRVQQQFPNIKVFANTVRTSQHASHQTLQGVWYEGGKLVESKNHTINPIIDRIGSGDAFMAGIIYSQLHQQSAQHTIAFATAAAVYKHAVPGDVLLASVNEIEALVADKNIGKLLR